MRIQRSLKNIKYNLFFFIISGFFTFLSRKVLLQCLGYEIVGLDSLFSNLLGFLSVAELGITSAITFSLYRPLMEKDYDKINLILLTYKYIYRMIAGIISLGVLILCMFIGKLINSNTISISAIRFYFILFAVTPISSYLLTYTQVIIFVKQEGYIISKFLGVFRTVKTLLQIILVYYTSSYTLWLVLEVIFTSMAFITINNVVNKKLEWLNIKKRKALGELIKENISVFRNTRDLFFHKLAGIVLLQTDNLVVSAFTSLKNVTIYSSYIMIISLINGVFNQVLNGLRPSVGNLIAENNDEKAYNIWKEIFILISIIIGIICYCVYKLINDFIGLWIGNEYLLDNFTVLCIVINLCFSLVRQPTDAFKDGYGIFWDKWAPMFESGLNLLISIILVQKLGIAGVVIGTNVSNLLIILVWKPYILFKEGFKMKVVSFYVILSRLLVIGFLSFFISDLLCNSLYKSIVNINVASFLLKAILTLVVSTITFVILSLMIKDFRKIIFKYLKIFKKNVSLATSSN